ncbi:MAG: 4a-hydroxytetrahydrobiopterin dehydratase [Patescibacteria group bacterium]|nr:MAG: 4a-hydroxytetrahydrobiopterin dehydratase [Patescibacteria group bacterium]
MWQEQNNSLVQEFVFKDFKEAFVFITKVAELAEEMDHHPTWTNTYNKVMIKLCTHDQGDIITQKDRLMAEEIDKLI